MNIPCLESEYNSLHIDGKCLSSIDIICAEKSQTSLHAISNYHKPQSVYFCDEYMFLISCSIHLNINKILFWKNYRLLLYVNQDIFPSVHS